MYPSTRRGPTRGTALLAVLQTLLLLSAFVLTPAAVIAQGADPATGATITPVYQTVTYTQDGTTDLSDLAGNLLINAGPLASADGAAPVSYEDIGAIIDALESADRTIAEPGIDVTHVLRRVLGAAREMRAQTGGTPTIQQLEATTGLPRATILTALRFADTLRPNSAS